MGPSVNPETPVVAKNLYINLIFLIDKEKHRGKPVFKRKLRRSGEEFPIYDAALYYQFTQFSSHKPPYHEWKFTSSEGQVDALQLHPFDPTVSDPDPAKKTIHKSVEGYLRPTPETLLVVCHYYNAFQKNKGEWAGMRASNDTKLLRLVVDFSSIMTTEGADLFLEAPIAYWRHRTHIDPQAGHRSSKVEDTPLEFDFTDGRVFSASKTNVLKNEAIVLKYKMNWDGLLTWQAYSRNKKFTPTMLI